MTKALGKMPVREPLAGVSHGFLDGPLYLSSAAGELGLTDPAPLKAVFRLRDFAALGLMPLAAEKPLPGAVRRDAWEEYYDQVVSALGLGTPIVPLDGETRRDYQPPILSGRPALDVSLTISRSVLKPGDKFVLSVTNNSKKDVFIELLFSGVRGEKSVMPLEDNRVRAGTTFPLPELQTRKRLGKERITLFASDVKLPPGVRLRGKDGKDGEAVGDRFVHPFYSVRADGKGIDVPHVLKKTIEIETVR